MPQVFNFFLDFYRKNLKTFRVLLPNFLWGTYKIEFCIVMSACVCVWQCGTGHAPMLHTTPCCHPLLSWQPLVFLLRCTRRMSNVCKKRKMHCGDWMHVCVCVCVRELYSCECAFHSLTALPAMLLLLLVVASVVVAGVAREINRQVFCFVNSTASGNVWQLVGNFCLLIVLTSFYGPCCFCSCCCSGWWQLLLLHA